MDHGCTRVPASPIFGARAIVRGCVARPILRVRAILAGCAVRAIIGLPRHAKNPPTPRGRGALSLLPGQAWSRYSPQVTFFRSQYAAWSRCARLWVMYLTRKSPRCSVRM